MKIHGTRNEKNRGFNSRTGISGAAGTFEWCREIIWRTIDGMD